MNEIIIAKFVCEDGHVHYKEDEGSISIRPCLADMSCGKKMHKRPRTYAVEFPDF